MRGLRLFFLCFIAFTPNVLAKDTSAKDQRYEISQGHLAGISLTHEKPSRCGQWLKRLMGISAAAGLVLFTSTAYHDVKAEHVGREHIGGAVYFDWSVIEKVSDPFTMDLVRKEKRSLEENLKIASYFADQLAGDYDDAAQWPVLFPRSVNAESYLRSSGSTQRGVCRHKAAVLAEILNRVGIPAELEGYVGLDTNWHLWVRLRGTSFVVDATRDPGTCLEKRETFLLKFPPPRSTGVIIHPKPLFRLFSGALR